MTVRHPFSAINFSVLDVVSFAIGALLLMSGAITAPAYAQSVGPAYVQITLPTTGLGGPWQAAKDASGNIYIADSLNARVVELPAGGGPQFTVPLTGLSDPDAVAVDKSGNLYVGDFGNGEVIELPAGGTQKTVASGLVGPAALAVDSSGNVLIADGFDGLFELPAGGGTLKNLVNGVGDIFGVAVDSSGNIYMADTSKNTILELQSGKNSPITLPISGLKSPFGVMVDTAGNIFVADTANFRLLEYPAGGGSLFTIGTGISEARALSPDGTGGVLVTDTVKNKVWDFSPDPVNFGSVNVCPGGTGPAPCSTALTLTYYIPSGTTLSATTPVSVVTQGAPNLDFTLVSNTCTSALAIPAACNVQAKFAPLAPGLRQGAVQLYDASGDLLVTTLLRGYGSGPQVVFPGGPQVTVNNTNFPSGVATDAAGNVYFSGFANASATKGNVYKIPAGCSSTSCYQLLGGGYVSPLELAVDGIGNIYVPDLVNDQVFVLPPTCTSSSCQTGIGFDGPAAVALDGAGDIFVAEDEGAGGVAEVHVGGSQTTVGSGFTYPPFGVALDDNLDVFIADQSGGLVEVPSVGAQSQYAPWLGYVVSVVTDAAGDVYAGENSVTEVPAGCASSACDIAVGTGFQFVSGLALDNQGNVYIADSNGATLYERQRSQAPTLSFASTLAGTTSSAMTVAIHNIGNQPLMFMNFAASTNFTVDSGSTTCSTSAGLAPGGLCHVGVVFAPMKDGMLTGTLTLTDNTLNASAATQSISLTGTGMGCSLDNDCASGNWCNESAKTCTAQLPNSFPIPTDPGHNPTLNGVCSTAAAALVCESGVCDTNNNECGYANGDGPCTALTSTAVCQSGACSVNNTCEPAGGCNVNGDCSTGYSCSAHACMINNYMVTPSVSGSGTISPSTVQTVEYGSTQAFTLTPGLGYHFVNVSGSCLTGTLNTNMYTTGAVTANCTVVANFAINTYLVSPSVNNSHGTISPSTVQTANYGSTPAFTVAANPGYTVIGVGGTCGGILSGNMYTTSPVTAACTVILNIGQAPSITSANNTTFQTGAAGSFAVTASGIPAVMNFTETGKLPSGVTLNPTSGLLGGTPAAGTGGLYPITITASNGVLPNATQSFTLTVDQPPSITSPNYVTFTKGIAGSFIVTSTGFPAPTLTFTPLTALPAGVHFVGNSNGTATISGTPTVSGVFTFFIKATNGVGAVTLQSFTLTVKP